MRINKTGTLCLLAIVSLIISGGCGGSRKIVSRRVRFSSSQAGVVKVMTLNIRVDTVIDGPNRWNNRKQIVFDTLADNAADVIGLQEALRSQVRDVQLALPQYAGYAAGRKDGRNKGESCAIFYRKERFALADAGTFWFSNTPFEPGSKGWGNLPPRICSWVYLIEKGLKRAFYVYNLHLDNFSQNSRKKSVKLLAKHIAARRTRDPFIVMGDFNMDMDNPAMKFLHNSNYSTAYPKMVDAWQFVHGGPAETGTRHNFRGSLSGPRIDHIPISENARALEASIDRRKVNGRYPSDHFPVIAKILLGKPFGYIF